MCIRDSNIGVINRYFAGFLAAAVVFGVFAALRFYLVTWLGERVVADLREAVYRRIVRMDPTFFEITRTGEVLSRLTADTTLVQAIAGVNLSITLRSVLNLIGALALLALTSAKLMAVILVLIPLVIGPLIIVGRRVRRLSRTAQDRIADTSSLVDESLNAIQTVQAFTLEELQSRRYAEAVERSFEAAIRRSRVRAALTAIGTMLVFGGITYVLWLGAQAVLAHQLTSGQLSQFLVYAAIVATSAAALTEMWGEMQRAAGAMERLAELLEAQPVIVAPAEPISLPARVRGNIEFERVCFRYPSRQQVLALSDFTLDVRRGETVAVVGLSLIHIWPPTYTLRSASRPRAACRPPRCMRCSMPALPPAGSRAVSRRRCSIMARCASENVPRAMRCRPRWRATSRWCSEPWARSPMRSRHWITTPSWCRANRPRRRSRARISR